MVDLSKALRLAADYLKICIENKDVSVPEPVLQTYLDLVSMISGCSEDKLYYDLGKHQEDKNENKDQSSDQEA